MIEAERIGQKWWVNPKGHPYPTLPDQSYLEEPYLSIIRVSCPYQEDKARELVSFAGKERKG